VERWHLRPELETSHLVNTWSVRSAPRFDARVVGTVRSGEPFTVFSRKDDWVELRTTAGESRWAHCKFAGVEALAPVSGGIGRQVAPRAHIQGAQAAQRQTPQPLRTAAVSAHASETTAVGVAAVASVPAAGLSRGAVASSQSDRPALPSRPLSNQENVRELLAELREQRRTLDALNGGSRGSTEGATRRARAAAAAVQRTVAKLEMLGVDSEKLLELDEPPSEKKEESSDEEPEELTRSHSFPHSEFSNPRSESCWLSTFFQSLWHSRVFHAAFERLVRPLPPSRSGTTLCALRETWKQYETAANSGQPVPVSALVDAWGRGYGDCADAFGKLQEDVALRPLADLFVLVPVPFTGHAPSPRELWERVLDMGSGNDAPIVALDFSLPPLSRDSIGKLVQRLAPRSSTRGATGEDMADLGERHRLVAMICYMEEFRHYIIFCRSLSDANRWLLFNDLPGTAQGVQKEYAAWHSVSEACSLVDAIPKMCLYESSAAATRALERAAGGGSSKGCRQM